MIIYTPAFQIHPGHYLHKDSLLVITLLIENLVIKRLIVYVILVKCVKKKYGERSRLTVVSREAKKEQSESPKTKRATNYCVSFTRANVFVI